ncbi:uncharacterized protein ACBR49_012598 isoform 2-T2 [Aulostomus maculatus]
MKTILFVMSCCCFLPVLTEDVDRHIYCESCLATAKEVEEALKDAPAGGRHTLVETLLSGDVCEKLPSGKHFSKDKIASACLHLLESHHNQFHAALVAKNPKHLDIVLCYEQSRACVGVKRQSFEDSKLPFTERDIDALLHDNKERLRISQPVHSGSSVHSKDEM